MSKGKLIIIEGTDGSGKTTQSKLLFQTLKKHKIKTEILDIPVYDSFTGELVGRYLRNDFGRINPYLAATLFAINRYQIKDKLTKWLNEGRVVVLNRYVTANQIHQAANLDRKEREKFKNWVAELEYKVLGMPKPDLILFINMPVEIAIDMIQHKPAKDRKYARGAKKDLLESDLLHQKEALREVIKTAGTLKTARIIDTTIKGQLLPKQEIADKIWAEVSQYLKI
ncbi:MAG: AAA family ATPase [Candidatus Doudnabacteria bacterium]|nr:AAA family ATPase [Candidatus Doudnabacteria bacterium]